MLRFGESTNGTDVTLHVGDEFEISLEENRTTGFQWLTDRQGEPCCSLFEERVSAPSRPPGAGGTHVWLFRAEHPGAGTIEMRYQRPWETEPSSLRTFRIRARVVE
jgi:predicted secreted protein